jgi:hypothetical protein
VDRATNHILLAVLIFLFCVCTVACIGHAVWMKVLDLLALLVQMMLDLLALLVQEYKR